ncbi:7484_t:CDS:10, partial [Racocetra persica]
MVIPIIVEMKIRWILSSLKAFGGTQFPRKYLVELRFSKAFSLGFSKAFGGAKVSQKHLVELRFLKSFSKTLGSTKISKAFGGAELRFLESSSKILGSTKELVDHRFLESIWRNSVSSKVIQKYLGSLESIWQNFGFSKALDFSKALGSSKAFGGAKVPRKYMAELQKYLVELRLLNSSVKAFGGTSKVPQKHLAELSFFKSICWSLGFSKAFGSSKAFGGTQVLRKYLAEL